MYILAWVLGLIVALLAMIIVATFIRMKRREIVRKLLEERLAELQRQIDAADPFNSIINTGETVITVLKKDNGDVVTRTYT